MRIKGQLLMSFALAALAVLVAGASGGWPLGQLAVSDPALPATSDSIFVAARTAATATGLAVCLILVVGCVAARSISGRVWRFRRDADALFSGKGEPIKISGTEDLDQVAAMF